MFKSGCGPCFFLFPCIDLLCSGLRVRVGCKPLLGFVRRHTRGKHANTMCSPKTTLYTKKAQARLGTPIAVLKQSAPSSILSCGVLMHMCGGSRISAWIGRSSNVGPVSGSGIVCPINPGWAYFHAVDGRAYVQRDPLNWPYNACLR